MGVHRLMLLLAILCTGWNACAQRAIILSDARVDPSALKMAFSAAQAKSFAVYEQSLDPNGKALKISSDAPDFHCYAPAYSPDGNFLLYLKQPTKTTRKSNYADIILYNRQSQIGKQLTDGKKNIRQALFSPDGKRIVYIEAGFFGSYSPVGPKAAHELDVHSMTLEGTDLIQHSSIKAYSLGDMSLLQAPDTYLVNVNNSRLNLSGTYAYTLSDASSFKLIKDKVASEHQLNYLPNLTVSPQKTVAYAIGDELFVKDMKTGFSEKVYSGPAHSNPYPMAFVGTQNMLIFSETFKESDQSTVGVFRINLLNLEDLKVLPVPIKLE